MSGRSDEVYTGRGYGRRARNEVTHRGVINGEGTGHKVSIFRRLYGICPFITQIYRIALNLQMGIEFRRDTIIIVSLLLFSLLRSRVWYETYCIVPIRIIQPVQEILTLGRNWLHAIDHRDIKETRTHRA